MSKQRGVWNRAARLVLIVLVLGTVTQLVIVGAVFQLKSVDIKRQILMIALRMVRISAESGVPASQRITKEFDDLSQFAVVLYDEHGHAVARSETDVEVVTDLAPEVQRAAAAVPGTPVFPRSFLIMTDNVGVMGVNGDGPIRYVAVFDRWATSNVIWGISEAMLGGLLGSIVAWYVASQFLTRRLRRGLRDAERVVHKMARGKLDIRLPSYGDDEIGKLASNFNRMADNLEQHIEELRTERDLRRRSFADWTHEIATPLSSVLGYLESLQMGDIETTIKPRYIATAYEQALALKALTEDLRTLSQLDFDGLVIDKEPVNVSLIVDYEVQALVASAKSKGIELAWSGEERTVAIGDNRRLGQVLRILLTNAIRHARKEVLVEVRMCASRGVTIVVTDDGAGIPAEHLQRLGQLFYRPDGSRNRRTGGRGLGLSIAKGIVEAHGGELVVNSTVGKGTSFTVEVPAATPRVVTLTDLPNLALEP